MSKGFDNVGFSLKPKSDYITRVSKIFGGKKVKYFTYKYPKESLEVKKENLNFGFTLDISGVNLSPCAEKELIKRVDLWFTKNTKHKSVVVSWKKL